MRSLILFLIAEQLKTRGFNPLYEDDWVLEVTGPKFRVRILLDQDKFQVAFNDNFDRWSNSTDLESSIPYNDKELDQLLAQANSKKHCQFCSSWDTPHRLANKPCCNECFVKKNKKKNSFGKRK